MSRRNEFEGLIIAARAAGWRVDAPSRSNGYRKCWSPDGQSMVVVPCTPSSRGRSFVNTRAHFRRAGLEV